MPFKPKPEVCADCPAKNSFSYVRPIGPKNAKIAFIGQGPGEREAYSGVPFVGPSGHMAKVWTKTAGLDWNSLWVDNVVRCWMPSNPKELKGNRPPTAKELRYCWAHHALPELIALKPKVIVACGVPAMKAILGFGKADLVGNVFEVELERWKCQP